VRLAVNERLVRSRISELTQSAIHREMHDPPARQGNWYKRRNWLRYIPADRITAYLDHDGTRPKTRKPGWAGKLAHAKVYDRTSDVIPLKRSSELQFDICSNFPSLSFLWFLSNHRGTTFCDSSNNGGTKRF
jgi:hypothetical protein